MYKIFYSWLFYFMLVHFLLLIYLFWANIKNLYQEVKKIDKKVWIILLLVFVFGFLLRNSEYWLGPHTDGYVAQESAHLWLLYGEFVKACALGDYVNCQLFEQVLAPPGSPFIIVLVHLLFGIHSLNASIISAVLSSLTIFLVFLIAYLIFKKEEIGLYASLIFAFIPLNIINSQTGLSRPTGLFFVGLTILFYLLALKNNKFITWFLTAVCLSYAIYVRQESYILLPFLFVYFVIFKWSFLKGFFRDVIRKTRVNLGIIFKVIVLFLLFFILQIPVLHWLLVNNPYSNYPGNSFLGLHYQGLIVQGPALFSYLFNQSVFGLVFHYNGIISIIFLITSLFIIVTWKKKYFFILLLFLAYFFVYSLLFDGNIQGHTQLTSDYMRRSLMFHLPYAIIAGYGIYLLTSIKKMKFLFLSILFLLISSLFISPFFLSEFSGSYKNRTVELNYSFYLPKSLFKDARATSPYAWDNDYFLLLDKTPNNCLVITSQHGIVINDYFKDNQRKTASIDLIFDQNKNLFLNEFKKNDCLIYIEDYRCSSSYRDGSDYPCQFLKKCLDKKELLFQKGNIKAYEVELKNECIEIVEYQ